ncbi:MAG: hypothetical protein LBL42_00980 [Tannerella sp.]|jgi:hypothetical protein|nr:hypothetical protein [Tannerella sp.]
MPTGNALPETPLYHSLQYGVPMSHTGMTANPYIPGAPLFENVIVPYTVANKCILTIGWYAFDLNTTAYNPAGGFRSGDGLQLYGQTQNTTAVSLQGTLQADITGTYTAPSVSTSGIGEAFGYVSSLFGLFSSIGSQIAGGNPMGAAVTGVGAGLDFISKAVPGGEPVKTSGSITLGLNGSFTVGGYLQTATSNNIMNTGFMYDGMFLDALSDEGVWSLQADPVMCVVKDFCYITPAARYNTSFTSMKVSATGAAWNGRDAIEADTPFSGVMTYISIGSPGYIPVNSYLPDDSYPCLIAFLDPASIRINLNTGKYPNLSDVNVSWVAGLYPNQSPGHTNAVRSAMGLPKVGTADTQNETWSKNLRYNNLSYLVNNFNDFVSSGIEGDASACQKWETTDNNLRHLFYGKALPGADNSKDQFAIDPQVTFIRDVSKDNNYSQQTGMSFAYMGSTIYYTYEYVARARETFYGAIVPDYVVWVTVSFKYTDAAGVQQTGLFSKRFLPDIRVISKDDLKNTYKPAITTYINNCKSGAAIQTINGKAINHRGNDAMLYKINKIASGL